MHLIRMHTILVQEKKTLHLRFVHGTNLKVAWVGSYLVDGVFARRRDGRWSSIDLLSYDRFLDPSYGFLVDDTCAIGVEIIRVAPTRRLHLDSTCYLYITGSFGISIVGIDPRPDRSLQSSSTSRFRCTIRGLSTEQQLKPCICKKFSSGGYDW